MGNKLLDNVITMDPFLNKKIFDMVSYATKNRVGTTIHSNLNYSTEEMARKAVESGLTHVYLSIDGATQETYASYRVMGNLDKVIDNLKTLVRVKKEMGSKLPLITWKYLVFEHNKHEVGMAKKMAAEIGVDSTEVFNGTLVPFDIYDEAIYYQERNDLIEQKVGNQCRSLWTSVYINLNGGVYPCSLAYRDTEVFGNIHDLSFRDTWNGDLYRNARMLFSNPENADHVPVPCIACKYCLKLNPSKFKPIYSAKVVQAE
ncbi:MAG: SPASM domain-containing protein [Flavobacteriales bacterium]|nr:SPASM domain-containing protein [Flavobacteriales bacterium]